MICQNMQHPFIRDVYPQEPLRSCHCPPPPTPRLPVKAGSGNSRFFAKSLSKSVWQTRHIGSLWNLSNLEFYTVFFTSLAVKALERPGSNPSWPGSGRMASCVFLAHRCAVYSGSENYALSPSHPKLAFENGLQEWFGEVGVGMGGCVLGDSLANRWT